MIIKGATNLHLIKKYLFFFICLVNALQGIFFLSFQNILVAGICCAVGIIITNYCFKVDNFQKKPLSTLVIFGVGLYYFILPPFITLIEFNPVIYNLKSPILTIVHSGIFSISIILAHRFYKISLFSAVVNKTVSKLYLRLHFFKKLNVNSVYIIGYLGVFSRSIALLSNNYTESSSSFWVKLFEGFASFAFIPFLLPVPYLFNIAQDPQRKSVLGRIHSFVYYVIILGLGFAVNSRSYLMKGFVSILFVYFFLYVYDYLRIKISIKKAFTFIIVLLFANLLLERFALTLVAVRESRYDTSPTEMVYKTFSGLLESKNEDKARQIFQEITDWDERYIRNSVFSRLCNLKFVDNVIDIASGVNDVKIANLNQVEIDKGFSLLPQPVLDFLNISVNKKNATSGSMGDYIYYEVSKSEYAIGTFRTGSLIGSLHIAFSWFYPLIVMLFCIVFYPIADSLVIYRTKSFPIIASSHILFSSVAFINLYFFCFYFTSAALGVESISGMSSYILRGAMQEAILFFILYQFSKLQAFLK